MNIWYLPTSKYLSSNLYQSINYHKAVIFSKHSQYLEPFYIKSHLDIQFHPSLVWSSSRIRVGCSFWWMFSLPDDRQYTVRTYVVMGVRCWIRWERFVLSHPSSPLSLYSLSLVVAKVDTCEKHGVINHHLSRLKEALKSKTNVKNTKGFSSFIMFVIVGMRRKVMISLTQQSSWKKLFS